MNRDEAKVRVRLDMAQAQADLAEFVKSMAGVPGMMGPAGGGGRGAGSLLASAVRAVGIGAGIGMGIEAIRGPVASGFSDLMSESLGAYGKQLEAWAFGDLVPQARAASQSREATIAAWGPIIGLQGKVPPQAHSFFNQAMAFTSPAEKGRFLIEQDETFRGPGVDQILTRLATVLTQAAKDAAGIVTSWLESKWPF